MRGFAAALLFLPVAAAAQPDFAALVRNHAPAVVSIAAAYSIPPVVPDVPHDEAFSEYLERLAQLIEPGFDGQPLGSGFLVGEGYVLTNFHVVDQAANDEVVVRLADGRELLGEVAGADPDTDLALVKVQPNGLPQVRIGNPARLQPGEWVATIGAPFGFERSVAAGIVSATGRGVPLAPNIPFIQTDLAMNPGHSGAPLFNARGEVVGVNSLIFSNTGASIGMSFAIPIDLAMQVAGELRRQGRVVRGRIGVRLQELTQELARGLRLPSSEGALVAQVENGEPAERAGVRAGDVVRFAGGRRIASSAELTALVTATAPGTELTLELLRFGKPLQAKVTVTGSAYDPSRPRDLGGTDRVGLALAALPDSVRRRLGVTGGVLVGRAEGPARRAGLVPGDVILSVNGEATPSLQAFRARVARAGPGESLALLVARGSGHAFVPLRVP